jgi:vitamin B12 transporter
MRFVVLSVAKEKVFPALALLVIAPFAILTAQATDTTRLESVVVTATRNPLSIGDVPASVTVLSGADLRARGIVTVTDALREVPGISVARSGSFGGQTSVFVRGGQSNYTKVLIDGVPVNESGGNFDFATLTTDNVERIEVVRGPSSVVWGSDAVTGVINIITRSGRGGPRMSASLRAGTFGTLDGDAQASQSSASTTYSVGIGRHGSSGIYAFNNRYGETVLSGRVDGAIDEKTEASFTMRYLDYVAHYPTDGTGAPVDSNSFNTASQLALSARVRRLINSKLSVQGTVTSSAHDGGTDDAAGQGSTDSFETLDHITRRGVEGRAIAKVGTGSVLTVGAQLEEQAQRSQQQSGGTFPSASVFTVARHDHAAFAELVSSNARGKATAGARVDGNQQFGSFGTFRLAGQYALFGTTTIRGSAGTAFREPSFTENFSTGFTTGNPNLKPEHTTSWEAGIGSGLRMEIVHLQLTYFDQRFVDLIDYDGSVAFGQPNYENIAKANARGVEFEFHHAPVRGFVADVSLTRLETKVLDRGFSTATTATLVEGKRLLRRPNLTGSVRFGFSGIPHFNTDVVVTYVATRDDRQFSNSAPFTAAMTLPAYTLVDLSGEYAFPKRDPNRPQVGLTFRAANLADTQYQSVAGYKSPGRAILGGVKIVY